MYAYICSTYMHTHINIHILLGCIFNMNRCKTLSQLYNFIYPVALHQNVGVMNFLLMVQNLYANTQYSTKMQLLQCNHNSNYSAGVVKNRCSDCSIREYYTFKWVASQMSGKDLGSSGRGVQPPETSIGCFILIYQCHTDKANQSTFIGIFSS